MNPRSAADYRSQYSNKSLTGVILAADSATINDFIAAKSTKHTIYVQRITLNVTTDAAKSLTFQDDANTPIVVGVSPASPGLGMTIVSDFGAEGKPLTEGKNLDITISGAGLAGVYVVECYEKLTGTRSYLDGASLQ